MLTILLIHVILIVYLMKNLRPVNTHVYRTCGAFSAEGVYDEKDNRFIAVSTYDLFGHTVHLIDLVRRGDT